MDEGQITLNFSLLWPKFSALWNAVSNGGPWTTEAFSAAIVSFLLLVFSLFFLWVIYGGLRSRSKIKFFESLLRELDSEQLIAKRASIREKAMRKQKLGNLWVEFDETLVISPNDKQLWNTVDAAYFFNAHTLASGITESRLVAAVPGFLTAVGVIGTFAGLQLGLSGLNLSDQNLDQAAGQIQQLIGAASVAFLTSVWGILTSVVFNFFEKYIEQILRGRIALLQDQVDYLFPKIRAEQKLIEIEDHNRESRTTLQGLAEKIGDRMQEAMLQMSENISKGISKSVTESLGPAINRLVNAAENLSEKQAESSTQALEGLVGKFVDKVGDHAEQQRQMINQASQDIRSATDGMSQSLESFLQNMESQVTASRNGQIEVLDSVRNTVNQHSDETRRVLSLGEELAARVSEMSEDLTNIGDGLKASTLAIQTASGNLDNAGGKMGQATRHFADVLSKAVSSTNSYVEESKNLSELINQSLEFLSGFEVSTQGMSSNVENISDSIKAGLAELKTSQESFLQGMDQSLKSIQEKIADLMNDYGERVSGQTVERMTEWNNQTRQFSESMVSAVQAIHDVVGDIESIVETRKSQ